MKILIRRHVLWRLIWFCTFCPYPTKRTLGLYGLIIAALLFCLEKNRRSYRSARVLLNLLNELGKRDKKRGLPSILSLFFAMSLIKFNNTGALMLDSIHNMTLKLFCYRIFGVKTSRFCQLLRNVMDVIALLYF